MPPSPAPSLRPLLPLIGVTGVNLIALGIIIPLLPFYVTQFHAGPEVAALIFSVFSAASLISSPFWGRLSDRVGRRPVLLASVACTVVSYLWLSTADSLWEVFASRAFAGLTSGWLTASQAYIADALPPESRARGLGLLGAAFGVGFIIGPALGGFAVGGEDPNLTLPALLGAGFTGAGLVLTFFFVKEPSNRAAASERKLSFAFFRDRKILGLFAVYFVVYLMFTALEGTFALWVKAVYGFGGREVAWYMTAVGVVAAVTQGGLMGRLTRRFGEGRVAFAGLVVMAGGLALMPLTTAGWHVYLPMALIALGFSLHGPAMQSLMSHAAPPNWQGGVLGTAQSTASLARIAGPAWAGFLFATAGPHWPYGVAAVVLFAVALFALPLIRLTAQFSGTAGSEAAGSGAAGSGSPGK